LSRALAQA